MCLASCVAAPGAIMRQVAATIEAVKSATRTKTSLHRHSALVVRSSFPDVQLHIGDAPSVGNCRPEATGPEIHTPDRGYGFRARSFHSRPGITALFLLNRPRHLLGRGRRPRARDSVLLPPPVRAGLP